jgi:hypothetical protein
LDVRKSWKTLLSVSFHSLWSPPSVAATCNFNSRGLRRLCASNSSRLRRLKAPSIAVDWHIFDMSNMSIDIWFQGNWQIDIYILTYLYFERFRQRDSGLNIWRFLWFDDFSLKNQYYLMSIFEKFAPAARHTVRFPERKSLLLRLLPFILRACGDPYCCLYTARHLDDLKPEFDVYTIVIN